jgi:prephenate dehydrogenase
VSGGEAPPAPWCVVVIGAGLIGASIGRALTEAGHRVHLVDALPSHARVAESLGAGSTEPPPPDQVRLVVVAVPPRALAAVIEDALDRYPGATVTDVGSVKAGVLEALWRHPEVSRYVGSHPMAGSQHSGPVTARADLFVDRTWVVAPHRRSSPSALATVSALAEACGARVVVMDVAEHDAAVARVSHLPHLMSVLMAGHLTGVPAGDLLLAGQGLRDVTRIAGSDPDLWEQIVSSNSAAVLAELRQIRARLDSMIEAVDGSANGGSASGDSAGEVSAALRRELDRGVQGTHAIPGKHGAAPVTYAEVVVAIPDAPGALGRLFADVGEAGVNVEDVSIEHDRNRQVGYLSLAVTPDAEPGLTAWMRDRGWDVQA